MSSKEEEAIAQEIDAQFGTGLKDIEAEPMPEQLPRGTYLLRCTNAYLARSGTSGRKQLCAVTKVLETSAGDVFVGRAYTKTWGFETEQNVKWFKRDMETLQLDAPVTGKGLLDLANQMVGIVFQAALVPNTEPQYPPNCFLNRGARRTDQEGAAGAGEGEGGPY